MNEESKFIAFVWPFTESEKWIPLNNTFSFLSSIVFFPEFLQKPLFFSHDLHISVCIVYVEQERTLVNTILPPTSGKRSLKSIYLSLMLCSYPPVLRDGEEGGQEEWGGEAADEGGKGMVGGEENLLREQKCDLMKDDKQ